MNFRYFTLLASCTTACSLQAAIVAVPSWDGDPGTTRTTYLFDQDYPENAGAYEPLPDPGTLSNGFGPADATMVTEDLAANWQDPAGAFTLSGYTDDGAWDIGRYSTDPSSGDPVAGFVEVSVLIALGVAPAGIAYEVDFVVNSIAYQDGLFLAPELAIEGGVVTGETAENEELGAAPPFGTWNINQWTGTVTDVSGDEIVFRLQAPASGASGLIDDFEIFTLTREVAVIPEPSSMGFLLSSLFLFSWGLRRR